ncbi:hypothetical protein ABB27_14700 [Stenotrophomonas terrae]|uniref:HTH marR-type domain-containing protein n=1 Tax=Stenotrophomonas terrae TaxID=405446 RepID=A0A0R0CIW3_9GAMM|nr:MarR family transcriptional regulator [Stenotrophomonas terrae]KRG65815.1 hypothetical protein ABB27_14700 [Stenotrophomonas terrae]
MRGRRLQVLQQLEQGEASADDISKTLDLDRATAAAVLSHLFKDGYVARRTLPQSGRGRPRNAYRVKLPGADNDE